MADTQQVGRKESSYYASLPDDMAVKKSGFIIFGDVTQKSGFAGRTKKGREPERHIVAAWSEGRFKDSKLAYQLPKGSVDGIQEEFDWLVEQARQRFDGKRHKKSEDIQKAIEHAQEAGTKPEELAIFIAGMRESYEETGVDILNLLGPDNLVTLIETGKLENVRSSKTFEGKPVTIKRLALAPVDDMKSLNRDGTNLRTQLFALQLEDNDILKLNRREHIKNHGVIDKNGFTVKEKLRIRPTRDGINMPNRADVLEWLNTGQMPEREWNRRDDVAEEMNDGARADKITGVIEGNENGAAFRAIVEKMYADPDFIQHLAFVGLRADEYDFEPEIRSNREFGELFQYMAKHHPEHRKTIKGFAKQMRDTCIDLGLLEGDMGTTKMDTNDIPGMLYQEGAQVMPLKDFFLYGVALAAESRSYDNVMAGNVRRAADGSMAFDRKVDGNPVSSVDKLYQKYAHSQLGMLTAIAMPADVQFNDPKRAEAYHTVKSKETAPLSRECSKFNLQDDVQALDGLRRDIQAGLANDGHPLAAANQNASETLAEKVRASQGSDRGVA